MYIIQLSLFNLVILGIMSKAMYEIWKYTDTYKWKKNFKARTKHLQDYIKEQNETVYSRMNVEIVAEQEGLWLEFILKEEGQMFEELIAERREKIFLDPIENKD